MWLVYPLTEDDTRKCRRGVIVLLAASATWYSTLAAALAVWPDQLLFKVRAKFEDLPEPPKDWTPFVVLLAGFVLAGLLRALGYRLCRNVAGAVGAGEGLSLAQLGVLLWLAACGTVYFGFTGFLAVVTALGTAVELKFLRFPVQQFGMVVSLRAVRRVYWFFYARTVWLILVILAGVVLLAAHSLSEIPRNPGGPWEHSLTRINGVLKVVFNGLAGAVVVTLPAITAGYWAILYELYASAERLLDPKGPVVPPQPPVKDGFDQLKHVIHNPF